MNMGVGKLKTWKSFLKYLEISFSVCAVTTLMTYSESLEFKVECQNVTMTTTTTTTTSTTPRPLHDVDQLTFVSDQTSMSENSTRVIVYDIDIKFPFKFSEASPTKMDCNGEPRTLHLKEMSFVISILFVSIGYLSLLFTSIDILLILFYNHLLFREECIGRWDLIVNSVLVVLWFAISSRWIIGVSDLNWSTSEKVVIALNEEEFKCTKGNNCSAVPPSGYVAPIMSVVFGFGNVVLYSGNLVWDHKDMCFMI